MRGSHGWSVRTSDGARVIAKELRNDGFVGVAASDLQYQLRILVRIGCEQLPIRFEKHHRCRGCNSLVVVEERMVFAR